MDLDAFATWLRARNVAESQIGDYRAVAAAIVGRAGGAPVQARHVDGVLRQEEAGGASAQRLALVTKAGEALLRFQRESQPRSPAATAPRPELPAKPPAPGRIPTLTPAQAQAVQEKVTSAASAAVTGVTWLVTTLRRIEPRIALLVLGVSGMGAFMLLMSLAALVSGDFVPAMMVLFVAALLIGLALFLLRQQSRALEALDAAVDATAGAKSGLAAVKEDRVELVTYSKDGWTYGATPYGALVVRRDALVFKAEYRKRDSVAGAALEMFGVAGAIGAEALDAARGGGRAPDGEYRFEFPRESILSVSPPGAGPQLVVTTKDGAERFGVVYDSWVPLIEALARHGYPLARD